MENSKCVVFCRVSTAGQADQKDKGDGKGDRERWSLPIQVEYNLNYAEKNHLELAHEPWSIVESGYKDRERKEFRAMLAFIKENRVGNLIVLNVERLSRNFQGMVDLDELTRDFLSIHFTESGEIINNETAGDKRAFWAIKVAFARYYIDDLKEKARRSYEARFDRGLYASNCSLGYRSKNSHLTPDEKEAPFVRRAFELYASGMESEFSLAEKLYQEGFRTRKGRKVSDTTLSAMLNNPLYLGYVLWPWEESKYVSTQHSKGEKIKGQHEAIVDQAVFDKVQEVLGEKGRPHSKTKRFYVYRGIFKCGYCHKMMSAYESKGHNYYASSHPHGGRCEQVKCYREEELTKQIETALGRFSFPADLYDWMREMVRGEFENKKDTTNTERKRLEAEATRLKEKIENALDKALEGIFDRKAIKEKVDGFKARLAEVRDQLARIDKDQGEFVDDALLILDLVQDLPKAFAQATGEQRNRLLKTVFKEVIVKDGKFEFRVNAPFSALFGIPFESRSSWLGSKDSNLDCMIHSPLIRRPLSNGINACVCTSYAVSGGGFQKGGLSVFLSRY